MLAEYKRRRRLRLLAVKWVEETEIYYEEILKNFQKVNINSCWCLIKKMRSSKHEKERAKACLCCAQTADSSSLEKRYSNWVEVDYNFFEAYFVANRKLFA